MKWLDLLWPGWGKLPGFNLFFTDSNIEVNNAAEQVTNLFISILIFLLSMAILWTIINFLYYSFRNGRLLKQIRECTNNPQRGFCPVKNNAFIGFYKEFIWDGDIAKSTADPEDYFNGDVLYPNIVKSHIIPLVVQILVGLGVLGTFIGLTLGLNELNFSESGDQLILQIKEMTAYASTAFVTSVWGVASSLLLNLIFRFISSICLQHSKKISSFVREKFPTYSPVDSFINSVSENLKGSKDTLDGLAEEIGKRLQTNLEEMILNLGEAVKKSMSDAIVPALNQIVEKSNSYLRENSTNAEDAIEAMIEKFLDGIEKSGINQQKLMNDATVKLNETLDKNVSLLRKVMSALNDREKEHLKNLEDTSSSILSSMQSMVQAENEKIQNSLYEIISKIIDVLEYSTSLFKSESSILEEASNNLQINLEKSIKQQLDHENNVYERNKKLIDDIDALFDNHKEMFSSALEKFQSAIEEIRKEHHQHADDIVNTMRKNYEQINVQNKNYQNQLLQQSNSMLEESRSSLTNNIKDVLSSQLSSVSKVTEEMRNSLSQLISSSENIFTVQKENLDRARNELTEVLRVNIKQQANMGREEKNRINEMIENVNQMISQQQDFMNNISEKMLSTINDSNIQQRDNVQSLFIELRDIFKQITDSARLMQDEIYDNQNKMINEQHNSFVSTINDWNDNIKNNMNNTDNMTNMMIKMQDNLSDTIKEIKALPTQFGKLCGSIESSSRNMKAMSEDIRELMTIVSSSIEQSIDNVDNLVHENQHIFTNLKGTADSLQNTSSNLKEVSNTLNNSSNMIASQYTKLADNYDKLQVRINKYIDSINEDLDKFMNNYNENVTKLLDTYVGQVEKQTVNRLREWDKETENFCKSIIDAVSTLSEFVDEFENSNARR